MHPYNEQQRVDLQVLQVLYALKIAQFAWSYYPAYGNNQGRFHQLRQFFCWEILERTRFQVIILHPIQIH